jgi:hypothetical protein
MIVSLPTLDGRSLYVVVIFPLDKKRVAVGRFRKLSKGIASLVA